MEEPEHEREIASIRRRLVELAQERKALEARLGQLLGPGTASAPAAPGRGDASAPVSAPGRGDVTAVSPAAAKVALFRDLFAGRTDVFPVRWENAKAGARRLRAGLRQRVGRGRLRQAAGEVRRVPEPGLHPGLGPCRRGPPARRRTACGRGAADPGTSWPASIPCCRTRPAASSRPTSTARTGRATRSPTLRRAASGTSRPHSSAPARARAGTSGSSSPSPSPRARRASSAPRCSPRPWSAGPRSGSPPTTGCSRARTPCRPAASAT